MITIKIGPVEATIEQADDAWINQQINRRRADGAVVCVQVSIQEPDVHMALSTPTCATNGGGGRAPNQRERRIFDLWSERGLDERDFTGGALVAFLHQLRRLV
jgi:hypothetical protein